MKSSPPSTLACVILLLGVVPALPQKPSTEVSAGDYFVAERGPHHRVWARVTAVTNVSGRIAFSTNSYPVANGATTCWERWNSYLSGPGANRGYYPSFNSFNHLPFGTAAEWLWKVVGGINPDPNAPGFQNVLIRPEPGGGITNATASHWSIRGPIVSSWTNAADGHSFSLAVAIPANTRAVVYIPSTNNLSGITENALALGLPATNSPRVLYWYPTNTPGLVNGATAFVIGSGVYIFSRSDL